ncbi:MAG: phage holin family protein [Steroidobacteraceae bacterium]|nr:phage holin family protein [Steroidobacteraceae bacterium]
MHGEPYEPGPETEARLPGGGLLQAARRMLATLIAIVHTRLELFTTEIQEEIYRAAGVLVWGMIALFFGSLTVLMLAVTILVIFWDDNRVLAAILITATFLVLALITALLARARLRARPGFMSASLEELKRDRESLERAM